MKELLNVEILNCMKETSVCILKADGHTVLFRNDAMKRIEEEIGLNRPDADHLSRSRSEKLLCAMEGRDSYSTVFFDEQSGQDIDVTVSRMTWSDDVPAFLITLSAHLPSVLDRHLLSESRNLIRAVTNIYPMIISANLTQNTYHMVEYDDYFAKKAEKEGCFDDLIRVGTSTTHPDYQPLFANVFSRENQIRKFESGEKEIYLEALQMGYDQRTERAGADSPSV